MSSVGHVLMALGPPATGLGAVISGIVPKMAIRFASFEQYKYLLTSPDGTLTGKSTFLAGLAAGATEAVAVVGPMEVVKIRLQAQLHSMSDPLEVPKYRNAAHALYLILKEEGPTTLYRGVALTALRQATNQAANFTAYTYLKAFLLEKQPQYTQLPSYQSLVIGCMSSLTFFVASFIYLNVPCPVISGAVGPFTNAPIDTIKTRVQRYIRFLVGPSHS